MAEILKNTNAPIYHQVFWKGGVVDADVLPTVKVYDITEDPEEEVPTVSQLVATLTSEKDETNIGSYAVYLPLQLTNSAATYRLLWEYTVETSVVSYRHDVFITVPYADLYQASTALGISTDPSDPSYKSFADLAEAERYARRRIEEYTGQRFYIYGDVYRVLGSDSDTLPLPDKIDTIDRLYMNDILLVDNLTTPVTDNWNYDLQISETNFGIRINRANMLDNTVYTANGMIPPTIHDSDGIFRNNVMYEVHGKFGWRKIPQEVELACIELMKDYFAKDNTWKNQYVKNIQTFDWQFEYNSEAFTGTGNAYADRLLADFVVSKASLI